MGTTIQLTPPNTTATETIHVYESVSTQQSTTDRAGSFSLVLPFKATADVSAYVVNTDVRITQDSHVFRGFVKNPPKVLNGSIKYLTLEGLEYAAKTQSIIVTESYTADYTISYVVNNLVSAYLTWATADIETSAMVLNAKYPDKFLWDVMEDICSYSGYSWYIDENLVFHFFSSTVSTNTANITASNYWKGSANFAYDSSKLVNKLWVKGATAISATTASQTVVVTTANITLDYKPHNIKVMIGTAQKTVGIQNIDATGTKDFLLNYNEKLLIPDLTTSGTAVITYNYQYPVKILLYDNASISTYGQIEDMLKVTTNDRDIATQQGLIHLNKYKAPVLTGSISPFEGNYKPGQLVNVNIPNLDIDSDLVIKSVSYDSIPTQPIKINLQLENRLEDITDVLKQFSKRLDKLEAVGIDSDNELVEQYRSFSDDITTPVLQDDGISYYTHEYLFSGMPYAGTFYI